MNLGNTAKIAPSKGRILPHPSFSRGPSAKMPAFDIFTSYVIYGDTNIKNVNGPLGPTPPPHPSTPSPLGGGEVYVRVMRPTVGRSFDYPQSVHPRVQPPIAETFESFEQKKKHDHNILCQRMNGSLEVPPWNPLECTWRKWIQTSTISSTVKKVVPESLAEGWFDTRNTNWRREGPRTECSLF